jgi:general secretion pathway protein D
LIYSEVPLRRYALPCLLAVAVIILSGCPKSTQNYNQGQKAEETQDYDTALLYYQKALKLKPQDAELRIRVDQMRFQAGQFHIEQGQKFLAANNLTLALAEFQKAKTVDPSNTAADQEIQRTLDLISAQQGIASPHPSDAQTGSDLLTMPPELKPLSREPINLKMTNDGKIVFETIAKLAGLSVIFDPDFNSKRITVELPNVTLEQALDAVAIEAKAFWKPVTSSIILVAPDQPQKRRDLEDEVVKTFYLSNTLTPQDITEIVTGLRQLLDLKRLQQVNAQNAIVIRDTQDKVLLAGRILDDIDKARPEVLIQVEVLEARLDNLNQLGILPSQSPVVALAFTPRTSVQPNSGTTSGTTTTTTTTTPTTGNQITLNNLAHLASADYSVTLPSANLTALLTDTGTRIIQDPEVRVSDGQQAKLRIGDKVPIATGSFQAGVGVSTSTVSPLVNTQFQYQDVGVNIDVTPRVHPGDDISMKLKIEVSSVTGESNLGGIEQPIISQRTVEHEVRLHEGEVSILGGLIQHTVTNTVNGWPGLANIPFVSYLFSQHDKEVQDDDVIIVITPHIIRMPAITAANLQTIATGSDTNVRVYREQFDNSSPAPLAPASPASGTAPSSGTAASGTAPAAQAPTAMLKFEPATMNMRPGDTATIGLEVQNVHDLFSIPLLLQYDPAVIQIDDVRNGGFLSGGTQEIAIVQHVDQKAGQAIISAARQPGTQGINGSGTLLGLVVRAVAPGSSSLQVAQVNARDSQQHNLPISAGTATIQVK